MWAYVLAALMETSDRKPALLVVDDDPDIREVLQLVLASRGYEVALAEDGLDALEKLREIRPCLILLDLMMPRMSGFDFLEERSRRAELASIPVVVVSAYDDLATPLEGVAAVVPKPAQLQKLLGTVELLCGSGLPPP